MRFKLECFARKIRMKNMFLAAMAVLMLLMTSCSSGADVDFGKGKYREPFSGVFAKRPEWLEATLNWPIIRSMKPDTVVLSQKVRLKFYKDAVKYGDVAMLRFSDTNGKMPKYVEMYCDGEPVKDGICRVKATSKRKRVEIQFKINPLMGDTVFNGYIYNVGGVVKRINGHRMSADKPYAATWSFSHKIGKPMLLWSVWYTLFVLIFAAAVVVVIILIIRALKAPSEVLEYKLRKNSLPIKYGHIYDTKGLGKEVKAELAVLDDIKNKPYASDEQRMLTISNQHLKMFYQFVIPSRASKAVQKTMADIFRKSGNGTDVITLKMPRLISSFDARPENVEATFNNALAVYNMNLQKSKPIVKKWNSDIFEFEDNYKQAEKLAAIVKNIDNQCVKPVYSFTQSLVEQLDNLRSIAFCNIRLGVELANLIRPQTFTNEGKQQKVTDKVDKNIVSVDKVGDVLINIKDDYKKAEDRACLSLLGCAIAGEIFLPVLMLGELRELHNMLDQVKRLTRYKVQMTRYITRSGDYINKCNALSLRCIEIGNALVKMNEGFWAVYEPIARKFYIDKTFRPDTPTAASDYALLRTALNEYNKLNKVEL